MKNSLRLATLLSLVLAPLAVASEPSGHAFHVGKVVSMDRSETIHNDAIVLVQDGKITKIGKPSEVQVPDGFAVHKHKEAWLVPGLIDCHNHTAGTLSDLNDMVYQTNPGLNTRATIEPENENIKEARAGGVTAVLLIPGSGTNMSGFGTIAKTAGKTPEEVIVRSPGSLKIAQSGNPEWYFGGNSRRFMNWNTRQTLEKAKAYHESWLAFEKGETKAEPDRDPIFEEFRGLFSREFPASVHTQAYQVLLTTVDMLSLKMGIWVVLDHCTFDAWKVGPIVADSDCWTINGPRQYQFDRTAGRMIGNASGWWKNGVKKLGINTDAPVVPERELSYQATMACWYGWLPYPALKGVTRIPAEALGVYDQVGSIESGKDADFGIWTGNPLDPRSACLKTIVDGKVVYDAAASIRRF